jgi:hypothetical protein
MRQRRGCLGQLLLALVIIVLLLLLLLIILMQKGQAEVRTSRSPVGVRVDVWQPQLLGSLRLSRQQQVTCYGLFGKFPGEHSTVTVTTPEGGERVVPCLGHTSP